MRISAIVPCHNASRWIGEALRSIAAQTNRPAEVIVIDDASTDGSARLVEMSGASTRILRVNLHNAAAARNAGITAATGDWIALLDADDVWYPNHLERAATLLAGTPDVAFMSNHDWISLDGSPLSLPDGFICKEPSPRAGLSMEDFWRISERGFHFGHSTVLYRRDRFMDVGLFDVTQRRRHDIDLWLRMIAGRTWSYDTMKAVGYREGVPGSLSKDDAECDYFYLRALVKNAPLMATVPRFRAHLARQARRAMGIAFVDGPTEHLARIRALAWPHLPSLYRLLYGLAAISPTVARAAIRAKRAVSRRREGGPLSRAPGATGATS